MAYCERDGHQMLVPGGGLAPYSQAWLPSRQDFLVHVKPLGRLFCAQFRAALQQK